MSRFGMTARVAVAGGAASFVWNAENRLSSATKNGVTESYRYNVDGIRISETVSITTTRVFFPFYEEVQVNGSPIVTATKYYSFNGMTLAVRRGGVLHYTHTDHLGSSSGQTDTAGEAIIDSYLRYYAYGGLRSGVPSAATTDRTFTGQKGDSTGLLYYNARFYDPALGTFLSPDTLVPDPNAVIDYNRFAYVRNNPIRYNDPSGHCPWCVVIGAVAGGVGNLTIQVGQSMASGQSFSDSIREVNGEDVLIAAGAGAIAGLLAPLTAGSVAATFAVNAVVGAGQYFVSSTVAHGKTLEDMQQPAEVANLVVSAGLAGVGGVIAGPLPEAPVGGYGGIIGYETGEYAKAIGGKWFERNIATKVLPAQQAVSMISGRTFTGATVGNVNVSTPCDSWKGCLSLVHQTFSADDGSSSGGSGSTRNK